MSAKKSVQLGMPFSKANYLLSRDILFSFSQRLGYTKCIHCKNLLTRDTFSIEHLIPWQDSASPFELFFDINNIAFSCLSCNTKASRKYHKKYVSKSESNRAYRDRVKADPERLKKYNEQRRKVYSSGSNPKRSIKG